ncbi:MAG: hypothetical protein ACR2JB_24800 [Bryobacteraceae bacterium]
MVIRAEHMKAFEQDARRRFEDEMVAHSKDFSPPLCEVIGDEQLRVALRSAMKRAEGYGFTYRGPVRLFIEMMFLCGSAFDTDPQYAAVGEVLRASGDQMQRAQQIHELCLDNLGKVAGPGPPLTTSVKAGDTCVTSPGEVGPAESRSIFASYDARVMRVFLPPARPKTPPVLRPIQTICSKTKRRKSCSASSTPAKGSEQTMIGLHDRSEQSPKANPADEAPKTVSCLESPLAREAK